MTDLFFPLHFLAAGGLVFSFEHATVAGEMVLLFLAIASMFSWSVMVTKMRVVQFARKQTDRFLAAFRQDRQPLRLFESNVRFPGSPVFEVYRAGGDRRQNHACANACGKRRDGTRRRQSCAQARVTNDTPRDGGQRRPFPGI